MRIISTIDYPKTLSLIANSGIHTLDFAMADNAVETHFGVYVRKTANGPLLRLAPHVDGKRYILPAEGPMPTEVVKPEMTLSSQASMRLFENVWLPLPLLRDGPSHHLACGPDNWARFIFQRHPQGDQITEHWRITLAIDTQLACDDQKHPYLSPTAQDTQNGALFSVAWDNHRMAHFLDGSWVDGWLREVFIEQRAKGLTPPDSDPQLALKRFDYQGHYLNLLAVFVEQCQPPKIRLAPMRAIGQCLPVDLLLDFSTRAYCGVLSSHINGAAPPHVAPLMIRSLSQPYLHNQSMFSDSLEFVPATWGKAYFSQQSGRQNAFMWPSLVRIAGEAEHIARRSKRRYGASGLYRTQCHRLDNRPRRHPWYFNHPMDQQGSARPAIGHPLSHFINDSGEPLYALPPSEQMPVFHPYYSPSSLFSLMVIEILLHALQQINSVASRREQGMPDVARYLRRIVVVAPTALSSIEQQQFIRRIKQGVNLLWQCLEHVPQTSALAPKPPVSCQWDAACCTQLDWLYRHSIGHDMPPGQRFFEQLIRRSPSAYPGSARQLRIASLHIDSHQTRLAVMHYRLTLGQDQKTIIAPSRLVCESLPIGSDDLLLSMLNDCLLPALQNGLAALGVAAARKTLWDIISPPYTYPAAALLRRQITQHLLIPLAQTLLDHWTHPERDSDTTIHDTTLGKLLGKHDIPEIIHYLLRGLSLSEAEAISEHTLLTMPLAIHFNALINPFIDRQHPSHLRIKMLCQLVQQTRCDHLLLSGIGSQSPGFGTLLSEFCGLSAEQWDALPLTCALSPYYPEHSRGDAVSSAVCGALLLQQAAGLRLDNVTIKIKQLAITPHSGYFGALDVNGHLCGANIWHIVADNISATESITLPPFSLHGNTTFGFRSQDDEHWPATPLFTLTIIDAFLAEAIALGDSLQVTFQAKVDGSDFQLKAIHRSDGQKIALTPEIVMLIPASGDEADWLERGISLTQRI